MQNPSTESAPNRVLDLGDLERPAFRHHLSRMDELCRANPDLYLHPSKRWEYPWALHRANLHDNAEVLDAGCGTSVFPLYLSFLGYRVTAFDTCLPPEMLVHAGDRLTLTHADLRSLHFHDHSFDTSSHDHCPTRRLSTGPGRRYRGAVSHRLPPSVSPPRLPIHLSSNTSCNFCSTSSAR
jgi:SAM-dependent methyltransferase